MILQVYCRLSTHIQAFSLPLASHNRTMVFLVVVSPRSDVRQGYMYIYVLTRDIEASSVVFHVCVYV